MTTIYIIIACCGLLALVYSALAAKQIMSADAGTKKMQEIASAIQEGAAAYLSRQYKAIAVVGVIATAVLYYLLGWHVAVGFALGAVLSGLAGYNGMLISVRSNVRTTAAARKNMKTALNIAFKAGAITGMLVVGLGLLGVAGYYYVLTEYLGEDLRFAIEGSVALGFGASLISIFARLGGGIFTKGADVPRNPAVIADNVGDNVGDCAGMAADLFETYAVTIVATMLIAFSTFAASSVESMMMLPLLIGAISIIGSIAGTFFVRLGKDRNVMGALYKGFIASAVISAGLIYFYMDGQGLDQVVTTTTGNEIAMMDLFYCVLTGLGITALLIWITEYYTSTEYRPVRSIAKASETGHGTNVIQGLAISLEATALPVLVICAGIWVAFFFAGLFGIAIAATAMLSLAGMVVALDAYGPVTDNAGGIAEMANLPAKVRRTTDALDAVGNTTKAVTKGYAIGSAGLASLVLFAGFTEEIKHYLPDLADIKAS